MKTMHVVWGSVGLALAPFRTYRIPLTSDDGFHVEIDADIAEAKHH
jgi:hypothetical protein